MKVVYLSFDGALQPLGYSQVVRLLLALADAGHGYSLVTLERASDLEDTPRVAALASRLRDAGISWRYGTYRGGARGVARNVAEVGRLAHVALRRDQPALVHARGYQPAVVARALRATHGVPYLFDFRGLWIDERLEEGRWFTNPLALGAARRIERALFRDAAAVVSLAEPGAELLRSGQLTGVPYRGPLVVIPTSVDFDTFTLAGPGGRAEAPAPLREWAGDDLLLGWVGSLNRWYDTDASLALVRRVVQARPGTKFLCLTRQADDMSAALARHGLAAASRVVGVPHDEVAAWVRHLDWGLQLMGTSRAKAASMPTKFAEFIASGVRTVHHGCNDDVGRWVEACGTGVLLPELSERSLDMCALHMATSTVSREAREAARTKLQQHFSLASAAERYDDLLRACVGRRASF